MSASVILLVVIGLGLGQNREPYFEIRIPDGIRSENVSIRYVLSGDDFGGWVAARRGVSSYRIGTNHAGQRADRIKAILYAPGCAIEMFDVAIAGTEDLPYVFTCKPITTMTIAGRLIRTDQLNSSDFTVQAKYIARWAPGFLGIAEEIPLTIRLDDRTAITPDGRFRLSVPDFGLEDSELQLWAVDQETGSDIAHLIPKGPFNTRDRTGSIKIDRTQFGEILFESCAVARPLTSENSMHLIRRDAFATKGLTEASCVH
jgi:hypothetical protein